jgi:hypothetical protein
MRFIELLFQQHATGGLVLAPSIQKAIRAGGFAVACLLGGSGCYKNTFVNTGVTPGTEHDEWTSFFIFGLVGHEKIDVKKFCPGEVAMVRTGGNVGTVLVQALTIGIYSPRKVYVTCAAGGGTGAAEPRDVQVSFDESGKPTEVTGKIGNRTFIAKPSPVEGQPEAFLVTTKTEASR